MKLPSTIWVCLIFGLFFGLLGVGVVIPNMVNDEDKVETIGVISKITPYRDREISIYYDADGHRSTREHYEVTYDVYVTYEVDGKEMCSELNESRPGFYEGKEITIYYDRNNPQKIGTKALDIATLVFLGGGWFLFAIGVGGLFNCIKKEKMKKRARNFGEIIYATYIESVMNTLISEKGRHPYYITCEWINPIDNKRYLFKSDNIWLNPRSLIEDEGISTFPVYINMSNMKEYFVDISDLTR